MTAKEAREHFGLKDSDTIHKENIRMLKRNAESMMNIWSISKYDRAEIAKDIEAYNALLKE